MSTKNRFALIYLRIKCFRFVILFPMRCFAEVIEGFSDILCLFKRQRVYTAITMLESVHAQLRSYGPLDLADVDVTSPEAHVKVRLMMR